MNHAITALALLLLPGVVQAQSAPAEPAGAAPVTATPPICTDRPTKANAACTVQQGSWQVETDVVNWTHNTAAGVRTDLVAYTNPYLKYGLGEHTDVEVSIAPYVTARTRIGGSHGTIGNVGNLTVRLKQGLTAPDSKVQVAVIPFVKAPTARLGIGNREWEGGVAAPIVFALPQGFTLNFGPEVDILADGDLRGGRHAQLIGVANLAKSAGKATFYAELWTAQNFDPGGTVRQYPADVAAAYLLSPVWQIDVVGNFGLNRFTPTHRSISAWRRAFDERPFDARPALDRGGRGTGGDHARLCPPLRQRLREAHAMTLDLSLAAITALGLLVYLVAVLIRPERF